MAQSGPSFKPTLKIIPQGYAGTRDTVVQMKALVDKAKKDRHVIELATNIVSPIKERDHRGEVNALFQWVQGNIRYINDPFGTELVQHPLYTMDRGAGDCDDLSTLVNSLCASIGYDTRFKTIKADPQYPNEFSHVFAQIEIDGNWVSADASQKTRVLGWEPPGGFPSEVWGYSNGTLHRIKGIGEMATQSINMKELVLAWLNRKKKVVEVEAAAPEAKTYNKIIDPEYDPEEKNDYYGDSLAEGAGQYTQTRKETVYPEGDDALDELIPLPTVAPVNYSAEFDLDAKFEGATRVVEIDPFLNGVTHGTPEIR